MTKSGKIMAFLDLLRLTVSLLVITAFLCLMYAPAHTLYNAKSFPALCLSAVSSSPPSLPPPPRGGGGGVWSLSVCLLYHLRHHLRTSTTRMGGAVSGLSVCLLHRLRPLHPRSHISSRTQGQGTGGTDQGGGTGLA